MEAEVRLAHLKRFRANGVTQKDRSDKMSPQVLSRITPMKESWRLSGYGEKISTELRQKRRSAEKNMKNYEDQEITSQIIGAAIEVHKNLGPGLLESVYRICLCQELEERGLTFANELTVPVTYKNKKLDFGFRLDLLVSDKIIVEIKSVENILSVHESQLLTYLRLMEKRIGLLINFNVPFLGKNSGIRRRVLGIEETDE